MTSAASENESETSLPRAKINVCSFALAQDSCYGSMCVQNIGDIVVLNQRYSRRALWPA